MLGRDRDARISATEGRQLALDLGQPFWADWMRGTLAYLAAVGGDEQECREYAGQVRATEESVAAAPWAEAALILLDLGAGRVVDALVRIEAAVARPQSGSAARIRPLRRWPGSAGGHRWSASRGLPRCRPAARR